MLQVLTSRALKTAQILQKSTASCYLQILHDHSTFSIGGHKSTTENRPQRQNASTDLLVVCVGGGDGGYQSLDVGSENLCLINSQQNSQQLGRGFPG